MFVLIGIGIVPGAIFAVTALVAILAQIERLRRVAAHVALRGAVCLALATVTAAALVDLTSDVATLL